MPVRSPVRSLWRPVLRGRPVLLGLLFVGVWSPACSQSDGGSDKDNDGGDQGDGDGDGDQGDGDGDGLGTGGRNSGSGGGSGVPEETEVDPPAEPVSPYIVVDQFGYLEDSEKVAVLRDPEVGADAAQSFTPGATIELIDAQTKETVLSAPPLAWNAGAVHEQSGDKAYHFDFSAITTPGIYYVLDAENGVRSDLFRIASDAYRQVLKQALRTFFYQRAGFEKAAQFAGEEWADGASHVGPGQDKNARIYSDLTNAATERDLSGGWYDAGDFNKYTAWTADYIVEMARTYQENPGAFLDDLGIPESGNGVPDLLDEMRFGLQHLLRLQEDDGSVLCIVDLEAASPPSAATGPSRYGPATTNATIRAAAAYAYGALVLEPFDSAFKEILVTAAESAWDWANANPSVRFENNTGGNDLGAGQQEIAEAALSLYFIPAAVSLYRVTNDAKYKTYIDANFDQEGYHLFESQGGWLSGYHLEFTSAYLEYTDLSDASAAHSTTFLGYLGTALSANNNLGNLTANQDPYLALADDIGWGSNAHKSRVGLLLYTYAGHDIDATKVADSRRAAERYIHYIHGVNPLGIVYLSNMGAFGAHRSATQFYHSWFADGTAWDEAGVSTYGPPPGFLPGGPNASYNWDAQCPAQPGCGTAPPSPPYGQPPLKAYADFNDNWPLNSWEVTENSNGYQIAYIRLLSKFVR